MRALVAGSISDFLGAWRVAGGPAAGDRLEIRGHGIDGGVSWRLCGGPARLDDRGCLHMDGDHQGSLVHVVMELRGPDQAELEWNDGVTFPAVLPLVRERS